MRSHHDSYIHMLSPKNIIDILENSAWQNDNEQSLTSAITNDNDLNEEDAKKLVLNGDNTAGINAFYDIQFDENVKTILDIGGGRFDTNKNYLKRTRNIELLIWDPYNRSKFHNIEVQSRIIKNNAHAVTSMSVLNVIPEVTIRLAHINTVKAALVTGGKAYFKIWKGEGLLEGSYLPSATENAYQANSHADRFLREIEIVFGIGNVYLDNKIPNLIVANKLNELLTSEKDIKHIQKSFQKEMNCLAKIKNKSIQKIYANTEIVRFFSRNLSFFKKMHDDWLETHRHLNENLSHEYDKKFGLVPYKK